MSDPVDPLLSNAEPIPVGVYPLVNTVKDALDNLKAQDVAVLPIGDISTIADAMIVASGTSTRHVKALAEEVVEQCKTAGYRPIGVEGMDTAEWVLVDLGDAIVHIMTPSTRTFYDIERLWTARPTLPDEES
jgi:ribosome-associated protein